MNVENVNSVEYDYTTDEPIMELGLGNDNTITYNFYATILPLFLSIFSLNSDTIRFKNE